MGGNNKMVVRFLFLCFMFGIIFQSCNPIRVTEKEMIGIWIASDRATLSLNEDNSFMLNGFNPEFWGWDVEWYRKNPSIKVCGKGKWKIENKDDGAWLSLYFVEEQNKPIQFYNTDLNKYENTGCEFPMDLRGSNFPFYNKPP